MAGKDVVGTVAGLLIVLIEGFVVLLITAFAAGLLML